jgi:2'-5' RNA ligase
MDGLHLTLRFLGPTPLEALPELSAAVEQVARDAGPFTVRIRSAGAFPSPRRPRTIWLGVDDPDSGLAGLAADLDAALVARGWPHEDRPFRPHLTLARADGVRNGPAVVDGLRQAANGLDLPSEVARVVLFESVTGGGPATYLERASAWLGRGRRGVRAGSE